MSSSDAESQVIPILLPQAGNSMEEGTIVKWAVNVGDLVEPGVVLFELETDKATIEVEAESVGRLARIVVQDGETAPVKTAVAYLAESEAAVDSYLRSQPQPTAAQQPASETNRAEPATPTPSPGTQSGRVNASPAARKAAESLHIDLGTLFPGSGPNGRVLVEDVERQAATGVKPLSGGPSRRPISKMRRAIARNLQVSKQTVPHFYTKLTVDAAPMLALQAQAKESFKCSVGDIVVLAVSRAISEFTAFRSHIEGDELVESESASIGLAVAIPDGLVVPVLTGADRMSLRQISEGSRAIVENARNGRLDGVGEAVFTISNLGVYGVEEFSAIINPPESAILAVGTIREDVIVSNGALRAGKVMTVVLSADHRVIDGAVAAQFMARLKVLMEQPDTIAGAF